MLRKALLVGWSLLVNSLVVAQGAAPWPCADTVEGGNHRVLVSTNVSAILVEKRVLPDVSDLKGTKTNSTVVVRTLIDKNGDVRCVEGVQGDASLLPRSQAAAMQWHFKPFLLNGQPLVVETTRAFAFKKGRVVAR